MLRPPRRSAEKKGRDYWYYRVMSQPTHGSPMGLSRLFYWSRRGYQIRRQPSLQPLEPMVDASLYLIFHLICAHEELTKAFVRETEALLDRHADLEACWPSKTSKYRLTR